MKNDEGQKIPEGLFSKTKIKGVILCMNRRSALKLGLMAPILAGCGADSTKTKLYIDYSGPILGYDEVWSAMSDAGAGNTVNFVIRDSQYRMTNEKFIGGPFSSALRSFIFNSDSSIYIEQNNDCDDFALAGLFLMSLLNHNGKKKMGIAFGEFYYERDIGGAHAINVAICQDKNLKHKVVFYEPQTYSIVEISKKEVESCTFWRF